MQEEDLCTVDVSANADVSEIRRLMRRHAVHMGFSSTIAEELVLVASELGTNIVKHARSGTLIIRAISSDGQRGLEVEARDAGPGIPDYEDAATDGFTTTGSLGYGLGTVSRLSDDVTVSSLPGEGACISARKWLPDTVTTGAARCRLDVGAATRPHPRMLGVNGDSFVICRSGPLTVVGVIDGVGHGQYAQRASSTARREVEAHCSRGLDDMFRNVGRACRSTRGVAMALARFDCETAVLELASVGNIEVRAWGVPEPIRYLVRRGILGANAPTAAVTRQSWSDSAVLCMYSDGIRSHWTSHDVPSMDRMSATETAGWLLRHYARDEDDATVLVVKGKTHE